MSAGSRGRKAPREAGPSRRGLRTCLGCRERFERAQMVRVVCDSGGKVLVDRYLKAPGRGAHLCYERGCFENAIKRRAFGRAFKRAVQPVTLDELSGAVLDGICQQISDLLALGRRSNQILSGSDVLERRIQTCRLLLLAEDIADNSADRLGRSARACGCPVVTFGTAVELGATQGKLSRVALGLTAAPLATRVLEQMERRRRLLVAG